MSDCDALREAGIPDFALLPLAHTPMLAGKTPPDGFSSTLIGLFPYFTAPHAGRNVALYAVSPDYHTLVGAMLKQAAAHLAERHPGARFRAFVDASPIDEVAAAHRAGLGDIGQNGMLITREWGQFVFLGCLLTDIAPADLALPHRASPALCNGCGACRAACPTGALSTGCFDRTRCLSALTQQKGDLTENQSLAIAGGALAWGCDRCLLACPHNARPKATPIPAFYSGLIPRITPQSLNSLSDRAYLWRGRALLARNLALIAGASSGDQLSTKEATGHF